MAIISKADKNNNTTVNSSTALSSMYTPSDGSSAPAQAVAAPSTNPTGTTAGVAAQTAPEATTEAVDTTEAAEEEKKPSMRIPTTTYPTSGTTTTQSTTTSSYTPTGLHDPKNFDAYKKQSEESIKNLYAAAQKNNLASLKKAYDQNLSDAQASKDQISPQYQQSMNSLSAEYERQRRNNNMQAAANGLNTGARSQMALAQSANYQANQAGLARQENNALDEANRRINNLKANYQNAIAEAVANNNYKLAASMLEQYQKQISLQLQIENTNWTNQQQVESQNYQKSQVEAQQKAAYGDFSGYAALYGQEIANQMELAWAMQNPQIAWAMGKLSAEDYEAITGYAPRDPSGSSGGSSFGPNGYGTSTDYTGIEAGKDVEINFAPYKKAEADRYGNVTGEYGITKDHSAQYKVKIPRKPKGGYSASLDKAYYGAPGYLNENGQFVTGWDDGGSPAPGHEQDYAVANAYKDAYEESQSKYLSNLYAQDSYQDYMPDKSKSTSGKGSGSSSGKSKSNGAVDRIGLD